jgi:predicted membrane channel-forming protein YqfA (hemolysin III family)
MSPSSRKGAGIAIIVLLIFIWAALVASLAPVIGKLPILVQGAFYLVMGIVWISPLKPLLRWTETGRWRGTASGD